MLQAIGISKRDTAKVRIASQNIMYLDHDKIFKSSHLALHDCNFRNRGAAMLNTSY